ncbi:protein NRT1/ PTR FAMILY 4.5-like isoform X1 [Panicum hallii]|uniref:protein NRT1/ PTR FAMILY 4.5-like isoform X1 n=1 Tax=Panicum hallii TaxID=206008 RepID=UPI000DF4CAC2|nr:protein NRT1/ PTR FAMILY 4.5-like isoform X1 [Panicum hallii]
MAGEEVYVDWRGNAVDERRHGGIRATLFLYVLFMLRSCPSSSNFSVVAYFQGTLHLDIVTSSTVIGYLVGTVLISAALMNFISDAYIKRTTAIFVFGPCVVLGYMLLALQAHFPSLHPETCEIKKELNNCKPAKGWNLILLYMSLLLFAVGEGCMRSCIPSLGGDQFSNDDPKKSQLKSMFLIWLKFANSLGAIIGLVFLVWIENNLGWNIGFMICALVVLVGLLVAASGMPFYRMQKPIGSPLTRTLEVLVISSKKRQAIVDVMELQETGRADCIQKSGITQVDETKAITRMLPIFISCLVIYLPFTLLMTLTIQVGSTMDRGVGTIQIPSASLIAIPTAFHVLMQPCYSQILTPLLRTTIGHDCSITPLQRIGAGSVCGTTAACIATLVEVKRMTIVEQHGLTLTGTAVPMSVFWLVIQFFLLSIMDAASFGGLVEFIKSEAPPTMKPIAPAVQSFLAGLAAWSCCAFIQLVNRATRHGDGGRGWLDGTSFNRTRLDHFFLLLAIFELVALINYTFWARRYTRKLQRVRTVGLDEDNSRN